MRVNLVCQTSSIERESRQVCVWSQVLLLIICCFVLQSVSQQILIGFVDQLEINEPEDHHEKDEQELERGQY